jgi:hypothetical protein
MVETVARKLGFLPGDVPVTFIGGLVHSGETYKQPLIDAIHRRVPTARIVEPILSAERGAALLALESIGLEANEALIRELKRDELTQQI